MASITGRCLGHLSKQPQRQCVLANDFKSEDCAKRVRVWAGLPVLDSAWRLGRQPNSSHLTKTVALANGPKRD